MPLVQARIDTGDATAVFGEADRIYRGLYENPDTAFVSRAWGWFNIIFNGQYRDFQAIDVPYHDREHTMQGLLCLVQLLEGHHRSGAEPGVCRAMFELGVLAILLHDTGYLKRESDRTGTGAKYTLTHVQRSVEFAEVFMGEQGYGAAEIDAVRNMIQCTALNTDTDNIPFASVPEQTVAYAVATADLLGQMSADDYVDRLPQLYSEFTESYEYFGDEAKRLWYPSVETLLADTPGFWRSFIKPKLDNQCGGMYKYLNDPYPHGANTYLERIEANVQLAARRAELEPASD